MVPYLAVITSVVCSMGLSMAPYLAVITSVVCSMGLFYGALPGSHHKCSLFYGAFYGALPGSHYMYSLSYGAFLWCLTWQSLHVQSILWPFSFVPYLAVITSVVCSMGLFYGALPWSHCMCSLSYGAFLWSLTWQSLHVWSILRGFAMMPYLAVITCTAYPMGLFCGA